MPVGVSGRESLKGQAAHVLRRLPGQLLYSRHVLRKEKLKAIYHSEGTKSKAKVCFAEIKTFVV